MRNRSHIRPRSPDIPHIHASFLQHNSVPSATSDGNAPSETEKTRSFQDTNSWLMAKRQSFQQTVREVSNKPIQLRS